MLLNGYLSVLIAACLVARFQSVDAQCSSSQPLTLDVNGTIESPGFPASYSNYANCSWLLRAASRTVIRITFKYFSTEACCDYVRIHDGLNSGSSTITYLSGINVDVNGMGFSSTQQYMFISFVTDSSVVSTGFSATFESIPNTGSASSSTTTTIDSSQCPSSSQPQNFYGSGNLQSPNSPYNYPNNVDCNWRLSSSYGVVHITFSYFSTEGTYDYVTLYDGYTDFYPQIARLSGSTVLTSGYYSTQQYMYIRFVTDGSVTAGGFQAYFASSTYQPASGLDWWEIVLIVLGCVAGAAIFIITTIAICRHYQRRKKTDVKVTNAGNPTAAGGTSNVACFGGPTCVVCKDRPSDKVVLVPCGHYQFCSGCIQTLMTSGGFCPICRQKVQLVLPLYS